MASGPSNTPRAATNGNGAGASEPQAAAMSVPAAELVAREVSSDSSAAVAVAPIPPAAPSGPGSAAAAKNSSVSPTRPPYIPQFTLATQMILKRMQRGEPGGLSSALASAAATTARSAIQPATFEAVRKRLLDKIGASTMEMPSSTPPMPAQAQTEHSPTSANAEPAPALQRRPGPLAKTVGMSAIQKVNAGFTSGRARNKAASAAAAPATTTSTARDGKGGALGITTPSSVSRKATGGGSVRAGRKRKRGNRGGDDDDDDEPEQSSSSPSDLSDDARSSSQAANTSASNTPLLTTTKSGRQVLKPTTYNPAAMDSPGTGAGGGGGSGGGSLGRRGAVGGSKQQRTPDQAMCRLCSRLSFGTGNQIVFCDGRCNEAWHQRCHEPNIPEEVVRDHKRQWFCNSCSSKNAKLERQQQQQHRSASSADVKKAKTDAAAAAAGGSNARSSWAGRTPGQKRAYLTGLSHAELVELVMHCANLHSDLDIFPSDDNSTPTATPAADNFLSRAEIGPHGPINYIRKVSSSTNKTATTNGKGKPTSGDAVVKDEDHHHQQHPQQPPVSVPDDGTWDDPTGLLEAWKRPRPGGQAGQGGLYASALLYQSEVGPDAHMEDLSDFEAFSHTLYGEDGVKVEDNGLRV